MKNDSEIGDIGAYITNPTQIGLDENAKKNRNRKRWRIALFILVFAQFVLVGWQIFNSE